MFKDLLIATTLYLCLTIASTHGEMEKRQVGVLARTGVLPQGKRSVQALARGGELPGKRMDAGDRQKLWDMINWIQQREAAIELQQELEQEMAKRNVEAMARAGYLVKPATENPPAQTALLDSDEFLGKTGSDWLDENDNGFDMAASKRGGLASLARNGYVGKRGDETDLDDVLDDGDDKRSLGAAKNFLSVEGKRNLASMKHFISRYGKRNIGSFMNLSSGKRHLGSALKFANGKRSFDEEPDTWEDPEEKRNIGSARRFGVKRNLGAARNFLFNEMKRNLGAARNFWYGKRNLASFARDGGFSHLKYNDKVMDYPWEDDDFDFDDFHDNDKRHIASFAKNWSGKRYLGSLRAGKRNVAAFKNFGKRLSEADPHAIASVLSDAADEDNDAFLGKELDGESVIEKRETNKVEAGPSNSSRRKRSAEFVFPVGEIPASDLRDYNDYEDDYIVNNVEKRFLGRLPQLGRVPQKAQAQPPPGRRRPQLRPNWL